LNDFFASNFCPCVGVVNVTLPLSIINFPDVESNISLLQSNIFIIAFLVVTRGMLQFPLPVEALNVPVILVQVIPLSSENSNLTQFVPPAIHSNCVDVPALYGIGFE
jgi:hypothetical protein